MTDRKLATIRVISQLKSIPNADLIEVAVIDGWEVVVKKNEFNIGDLCVYLEIDSWVPTELAPFLSKGKEPREYQGIKGERLRTAKLKGQLSQGLVLPLSTLDEDTCEYCQDANYNDPTNIDLTEKLNILKWEPVIPAQLAGKMAGNFPSFIPKTNQERIQNYIRHVVHLGKSLWEVTEKLDGSSMTVFRTKDIDGSPRMGVCSRNWELKLDDESNAFVSTTLELDLLVKLHTHNLNIALQGELCGPGIQGNPYKLSKPEFFVFDIWDIDTQQYYSTEQRLSLCKSLGIKHAPVFANYLTTSNTTVSELLTFAEGQSVLNTKAEREGYVFKNVNNPSLSFKAISNKWLLKND
jgi:RNA ligase (TIGR02306 family)